MGGYNSLPVQSGRNPYLQEIDEAANNAHAQLSPGAQMALKKAGAPVGMTDTAGPQALPAGALKPPAQPIPTVGQPQAPQAAAPRQPIQPVPATPASAPAQAELQRLTVGPQATAGVNQIHNPWARVPLQILSAVGETFAPRLAAALPGTESHHQMLVGNAENAVKQQEDIRKGNEGAQLNAAQTHHAEAEAANQESLPELHQAQAEAAAAKQSETSEHNRATEDVARTKAQATADAVANKLRIAGYDPTTGEPLPYEQLSEQQQAVHDWKAAQSEQANATAELRRAQAAGEPAKVAIAQQRIQGANNARSIAERRLALSEQREERMSFGTRNGEPLPGALLTDEGQPVGTGFQQNVRPTGTQKDAAGRAVTMEDLDKRIRASLSNPELAKGTGPLAGRLSEIEGRYGSLPHDLSELRNDLVSYGAFQAGLHPVRGIGALQYFDKVMGGLGQDPQELLGKLDSNLGTSKSVRKVGERPTVGSSQAQPPETTIPYKVGAKTYNIPASQEKEFLKDHPEAKK